MGQRVAVTNKKNTYDPSNIFKRKLIITSNKSMWGITIAKHENLDFVKLFVHANLVFVLCVLQHELICMICFKLFFHEFLPKISYRKNMFQN